MPGVPNNLAGVLLDALSEPDLDARLAKGLPWVALAYVDWDWLVRKSKLEDPGTLAFVLTRAQLG
jgi:hypothetical protein